MLTPARLGFTGSLAMALKHRWDPEALFVKFTAYIDESGTHADAPVTVMAGHIAKVGRWQAFDRDWQKMLKREGITHTHAKDIVQGNKEFRGWSTDRREALIQRASKIIRKHTIVGFVASFSNDDYEKHYVAGERTRKFPLDTKYGLCFRLCLQFLYSRLPEIFPEVPIEKIEIYLVLESGHKNAGDALRIFEQFKQIADPVFVRMVKGITFVDKKDSPGVQAADQTAYGAWKQEQQPPVGQTPIAAGAYPTIRQNKGQSFRLHADEAVLKEIKSKLLSAIALRKEHWERGGQAEPAATKLGTSSEEQPA